MSENYRGYRQDPEQWDGELTLDCMYLMYLNWWIWPSDSIFLTYSLTPSSISPLPLPWYFYPSFFSYADKAAAAQSDVVETLVSSLLAIAIEFKSATGPEHKFNIMHWNWEAKHTYTLFQFHPIPTPTFDVLFIEYALPPATVERFHISSIPLSGILHVSPAHCRSNCLFARKKHASTNNTSSFFKKHYVHLYMTAMIESNLYTALLCSCIWFQAASSTNPYLFLLAHIAASYKLFPLIPPVGYWN